MNSFNPIDSNNIEVIKLSRNFLFHKFSLFGQWQFPHDIPWSTIAIPNWRAQVTAHLYDYKIDLPMTCGQFVWQLAVNSHHQR